MKKSKRSYLIIALIVILLGLGIGYAALSQNLEIIGNNIIAQATFDVYFSNATGAGATVADSHTVKIQDVTLSYPGAKSEGSVTVTNGSTVGVSLTGLAANGLTDNTYIKIYFYKDSGRTQPFNSGTIGAGDNIAASGTKIYYYTIEWPAGAITPTSGSNISATQSFDITLTYTQNP